MRRQEYIEEVTTWNELLNVADESRHYEYAENIYDDDGRDDYINEMLYDWARNDSWRELYERLSYFTEDSSEWWRLDDYGDWIALCDGDEEFEEAKNDLLRDLDEDEWWDDEEDGESTTEESDLFDEEEEILVESDEVSIDEMFEDCSDAFKSIVKKAAEESNSFASLPF